MKYWLICIFSALSILSFTEVSRALETETKNGEPIINKSILSRRDLLKLSLIRPDLENPILTPDPKSPQNLNSEITLYREQLLSQISTITNRYRRVLELLEANPEKTLTTIAEINNFNKTQIIEKRLQRERQTFRAWKALSQQMISLSGSIEENVTTSEQLQQLAQNLLDSLVERGLAEGIRPGQEVIHPAGILANTEIISSGNWSSTYQRYYEIASNTNSQKWLDR